jgi:hypothetical protein
MRGDQPQSGQRMRGPDESLRLSRSCSRSMTVPLSFTAGHTPDIMNWESSGVWLDNAKLPFAFEHV